MGEESEKGDIAGNERESEREIKKKGAKREIERD